MNTKLSAFLTKKEIPQAEFARLAGISRQDVSKYLVGGRIPRCAHAVRIENATQGAVAVEYWAELEEQRASKRQKRRKQAS